MKEIKETVVPTFKLIGLKLDKKTSNIDGQSGIDCGQLWQKFEKENVAAKIPGKLSDEIYAVYFDYDGDHTGSFSYFIGCRVNPDTELPDKLDSLTVPEQHYTIVFAQGKMPDCMANSWKQIWDSDLKKAYQYDFEIYGERSRDWSNAEVPIYVSSKR